MMESMLRDGHDGSLSSKRVITFLAFILCAIAFLANLFFKYKIDTFLYESMAYIVMAGLGVTVAEKFSSKQSPELTKINSPINITTYQKSLGTPLPEQKDPLL